MTRQPTPGLHENFAEEAAMSADKAMVTDLTRPIIGIENRTAQEAFDIMCDRIRRSAALAQADQPVAVITEEMIQFAIQYGPRCRDCADDGPVCPGSGLPCGGREKALRFMAEAINYGLKHRFISTLAHPPSKREAGANVDASILRERISRAIFDPGQTEGYKGERTLTDWQTDAVMRVLGHTPSAALEASHE